jgi:hypothetical protein
VARNSQKPNKRHMTCPNCHNGDCNNCVDVTRILAGYTDEICQCTRKNHSGEPQQNQILDPETGTVHAPGLTVDIDGKVTRHGTSSL